MSQSTVNEPRWIRRRLRAPQDSPSWLELPPLENFREALAENLERVRTASCQILGESLVEFRQRFRTEAFAAAQGYARELGWSPHVPSSAIERPWIVTGHQPVLAHPGVWGKNFIVAWMARQSNGLGLNLIVDNDLLTSTSMSVPIRQEERLAMQPIAFATDLARVPWEEAQLSPSATTSLDTEESLFQTFGRRVCDAMQHWNIDPLMARYWPEVLRRLPRIRNLSDLISSARHEIEHHWGVNNLELPISRMCQLPACQRFMLYLFAHAQSFANIHNEVLHEYRTLYRTRSTTHPVPELQIRDDRIEVPFWIWKAGEHHRRRLFVQALPREILLLDGDEILCTLPLPLEREQESERAVERLQELSARGYRLRTRALTTTLFARLGMGDLFIHGIGGAQYDEITDRIINRFLGIPAPKFFTATSTLHLPLGSNSEKEHRIQSEDVGRLVNQLRDLRYNPNRHLTPQQQLDHASLITEKKQLVDEQSEVDHLTGQTRSIRSTWRVSNHRRYHRLRDINEQLQSCLEDCRQLLEHELQVLLQRQSEQRIRFYREYSVWLYPETLLRQFYSRFLPDVQ